jgi:hypothetical protein
MHFKTCYTFVLFPVFPSNLVHVSPMYGLYEASVSTPVSKWYVPCLEMAIPSELTTRDGIGSIGALGSMLLIWLGS